MCAVFIKGPDSSDRCCDCNVRSTPCASCCVFNTPFSATSEAQAQTLLDSHTRLCKVALSRTSPDSTISSFTADETNSVLTHSVARDSGFSATTHEVFSRSAITCENNALISLNTTADYSYNGGGGITSVRIQYNINVLGANGEPSTLVFSEEKSAAFPANPTSLTFNKNVTITNAGNYIVTIRMDMSVEPTLPIGTRSITQNSNISGNPAVSFCPVRVPIGFQIYYNCASI